MKNPKRVGWERDPVTDLIHLVTEALVSHEKRRYINEIILFDLTTVNNRTRKILKTRRQPASQAGSTLHSHVTLT